MGPFPRLWPALVFDRLVPRAAAVRCRRLLYRLGGLSVGHGSVLSGGLVVSGIAIDSGR